jgi:hypothetical protein
MISCSEIDDLVSKEPTEKKKNRKFIVSLLDLVFISFVEQG